MCVTALITFRKIHYNSFSGSRDILLTELSPVVNGLSALLSAIFFFFTNTTNLNTISVKLSSCHLCVHEAHLSAAAVLH